MFIFQGLLTQTRNPIPLMKSWPGWKGKREGFRQNVGAEMERRSRGPGRAKHPYPILLTTITGLPVVFFLPAKLFFLRLQSDRLRQGIGRLWRLGIQILCRPAGDAFHPLLVAVEDTLDLVHLPTLPAGCAGDKLAFHRKPFESRVASNGFRKPGDAGFFISKLAPRHSLLNSTGTKDSLERFCALCGKNQPLIPQWRSSGSTLGSRPRKALNSSMGSRLPPLARISLRKDRPVSSLNSPSSSKRE